MTKWWTRIAEILAALAVRRRNQDAAASDLGQAHVQAIRYTVAGESCAAARLSLERNDLQAAAEHLDRAASIHADHHDLPELRAHLLWRAGRPDEALDVVERAPQSARVRLLTNLLRLQAGRTAEAMLDLHAWSRSSQCPPTARMLLASLQAQTGDVAAARRSLGRNLADQPDSQTLTAMLLLDISQQYTQTADANAAVLAHHYAHHPPVSRLLGMLELQPNIDGSGSPQLSAELADELSLELSQRWELIPSLVAAQIATGDSPDHGRIELLRRAVGRIVEELQSDKAQRLVIEALAELARLAGDADDARRWVRRGLANPPYSAKLVLMLDELDEAHAAEARQVGALTVLRHVARDHPNWSDVQRAMILRCKRAGFATLARRHLRRWLQRRPDDPLARQTALEMAA